MIMLRADALSSAKEKAPVQSGTYTRRHGSISSFVDEVRAGAIDGVCRLLARRQCDPLRAGSSSKVECGRPRESVPGGSHGDPGDYGVQSRGAPPANHISYER